MGVFKVPKATTTQRMSLVLDKAEIVYDTDMNLYFGGDGETYGGFPIGNGTNTNITEVITISNQDVINKYVTLSNAVYADEGTVLYLDGSPPQVYGDDFSIDQQIISWDGLGLDGLVYAGDKIVVTYESSPSMGSAESREKITLTQQQINQKQITLSATPPNPLLVEVFPVGGIYQVYGLDYTVTENILKWDGLLLDNLLERGDTIVVTY